MERNDREYFRRVVARGEGYQQYREPVSDDDASIGDLLKSLAADTSLLLRQEMSLARAEVRESGTRLQQLGRKMAIAAALALPGAMAVTAFLVIALGNAINSYVTSALIVGVVLLVAAWECPAPPHPSPRTPGGGRKKCAPSSANSPPNAEERQHGHAKYRRE